MNPKLFPVLEVVALASAYWPLGAARQAVRGTTLLGAYWWAFFALASWIAVAGAETARAAPWTASHLRYAAAALSMCPMMAVLGARRPGVGAWHFVVLVLLVVLSVPLLQSLLRGRWDRPLRCDDVWTLLFAAVLLVGTINYVPTRLAPGHCVVGLFLAAVGASASPWRAARDWEMVREGARLAPAGVAAGIWLAWWIGRPRRGDAAPRSWDRVWWDYRQRFGLIWSRRVQERFNASAEHLGWTIRLRWSGFVTLGAPDRSQETADGLLSAPGPMQNALRSLLRRFVSDEWLAERVELRPKSPR
jgi:hypothetical protein